MYRSLKRFSFPLLLVFSICIIYGCIGDDIIEKNNVLDNVDICYHNKMTINIIEGDGYNPVKIDSTITFKVNCISELNIISLESEDNHITIDFHIEDGKIVQTSRRTLLSPQNSFTYYKYLEDRLVEVRYESPNDKYKTIFSYEGDKIISAKQEKNNGGTITEQQFDYQYTDGNIISVAEGPIKRNYTYGTTENNLTFNEAILMFDYIDPYNISHLISSNNAESWTEKMPSRPPNSELFAILYKESRLHTFKIQGRFNDDFIIKDKTFIFE